MAKKTFRVGGSVKNDLNDVLLARSHGFRPIGRNNYEGKRQWQEYRNPNKHFPVDVSVRKEGDKWRVDVYDSRIMNTDKAHIQSDEYSSLREALSALMYVKK